jgi:hypothetical protein
MAGRSDRTISRIAILHGKIAVHPPEAIEEAIMSDTNRNILVAIIVVVIIVLGYGWYMYGGGSEPAASPPAAAPAKPPANQ